MRWPRCIFGCFPTKAKPPSEADGSSLGRRALAIELGRPPVDQATRPFLAVDEEVFIPETSAGLHLLLLADVGATLCPSWTSGSKAGMSEFSLEQLGEEVVLGELLSAGPDTKVFAARWRGSLVAIKLTVSSGPDHLHLSARERLLSRGLFHPHLLRTYAVFLARLSEEDLHLASAIPRRHCHSLFSAPENPSQQQQQQPVLPDLCTSSSHSCTSSSRSSCTSLPSTTSHLIACCLNPTNCRKQSQPPNADNTGHCFRCCDHHQRNTSGEHQNKDNNNKKPFFLADYKDDDGDIDSSTTSSTTSTTSSNHSHFGSFNSATPHPTAEATSAADPRVSPGAPPGAARLLQELRQLGAAPGCHLTAVVMELCEGGSLQQRHQQQRRKQGGGDGGSSQGCSSMSRPGGAGRVRSPAGSGGGGAGDDDGGGSSDNGGGGAAAAAAAACVAGGCRRHGGHGGGGAELLADALEVAQALAHLHSLGLVHGALKPSNVLLRSSTAPPPTSAAAAAPLQKRHEEQQHQPSSSSSGGGNDSGGSGIRSRPYRCKVADYGLARTTPTTTRGPAGAAAATYTAPEVLSGAQPRNDPAADVYSYGMLLCHMLGANSPSPAGVVPPPPTAAATAATTTAENRQIMTSAVTQPAAAAAAPAGAVAVASVAGDCDGDGGGGGYGDGPGSQALFSRDVARVDSCCAAAAAAPVAGSVLAGIARACLAIEPTERPTFERIVRQLLHAVPSAVEE